MSIPPPVLRVALPLPLPRLFDYLPPPSVTATPGDVGRRLRVPFGSGERIGVVAEVGASLERSPDKLRAAHGFIDSAPLFTGELLDSLRWLAGYLHAPLGEVLTTALPASLRRGEALPDTAVHVWRATEAGATARDRLRPGSRPRQLVDVLQRRPCEDAVLDAALPGWRAAARSLLARGLIERIPVAADDVPAHALPSSPALPPNAEQADALAAISATSGFAAVLLDGVTGSGKTEVYLQAIADCLARGRQALVLVPEIGLTPQMLQRFRARLGVPV
ncbi:MAG TPA: DEAD/DEAH box helicase, partial [Xanthomonadaceae bacterium]|nr:DEAD/DEAH box helicase [Xanthomonadaceae bacterium]